MPRRVEPSLLPVTDGPVGEGAGSVRGRRPHRDEVLGLEVEARLEAGAGPLAGVEEEDEARAGRLDVGRRVLAAELEVVVVVVVLLLLTTDVNLRKIHNMTSMDDKKEE